MRARRLLLVSHLAQAGETTGAERSLLELGAGFARRGREIGWLAPGEGQSTSAARAHGWAVEVLSWPRLWLASWQASPVASLARGVRFLAAAPQLSALTRSIAASRADAVLVNTLPAVGAAWASRRAGIPSVWRVAEIVGPGSRRAFYRRALERLPARAVAVSGAVGASLRLAAQAVIPTGVALTAPAEVVAARQALRAAIGVPGDALVIGHAGQIRPHKGQRELVAAASQLDPDHAAVVVLCGATGADPAYVRRVRRAGSTLGDRLILPGFLPAAVRGFDILAFTSLAPDPFPRVILEAMAAGVPIVAFRGGGVEEAVSDPHVGLLLPAGDIAGLGAALSRLAGDAGLRSRMGQAGRARVASHLSLDRMIDAYLDMLDGVAGRG